MTIRTADPDEGGGMEHRIVWGQCACHVWPLIDPAFYGFRECGECGQYPIIGVPPTFSRMAERLPDWAEEG